MQAAGTVTEGVEDVVFPFERRTLTCAAGNIGYVDEGTGPALLLLHPAAATSFIYKRMILGLHDRFRVIAPDFLGFGTSIANVEFDHSLDAHADSVNDFVERTRISDVTLVVNDTSGPIGLGAAGRRPDLYHGLVITDTFGFPLRGRFAPVRLMLRHVLPSWPVRFLNRKLNLLAWAVSTIAPYRNFLTRAERRRYQRDFDTPESRDRIIDVFEALGRDEHFLPQVEAGIRHRLAQKPTLLLYGQFDPVRMIGFLAKFRRLFPGAREVLIRGEEHFPILGSGHAVADAITVWYDHASSGEHKAEWSSVGVERVSG